MRLIDRYVIAAFLKNYLLSFFVLVGMYVVLDMIFNMDELAEVSSRSEGATVWSFVFYVADFYFFQIFLFFAHLSGIIPVAAAAFTLVRMVRFNELGALLAAGVPLQRIAVPMLVCAVGLNALVWIDQEVLIPRFIPKLIRKHDYGAQKEAKWFTIFFMRDGEHRTVHASRYFSGPVPHLDYLDIIETDSSNHPVSRIRARSAEWDAGQRLWKLTDGWLDKPIIAESGVQPRAEKLEVYQSPAFTPDEVQLYRRGDFVELLSTRHINELLQRPQSYGREDLLRVKHFRGPVQMATNMIILILAIAGVLTRDPQEIKSALARCVFWSGACMGAVFLGQQLAGKTEWIATGKALADRWPALMAWLPIFVFAPIAVYKMDRVKS